MSTEHDRLPAIPDGGWGWVVVIGAFVHHVITHGVFLSIGIIFTSLQDALNGSKAEIAWIVSIEIGSGFLSGPITGFLISRYGTRIVSCIGALLGSTGYILSVWADNVYILYGTMGLISGVGLGMVIISAIVVVNEYFDAHRSLAAGISMAGTGCGAFLFNPLLNWLVDKYGWQGSLLLLSAIILNCIPAGLVYRPLKRGKQKHVYIDEENKEDQPGYKPIDKNLHSLMIEHKGGSNFGSQYSSLFKSRDGVIELIYDDPNDKIESCYLEGFQEDNKNESWSGSTNQENKENCEKHDIREDKNREINLFDTLLHQLDKTYEEIDLPTKLIENHHGDEKIDQCTPLFKSRDGVIELIIEEPMNRTDTNESHSPLLSRNNNGKQELQSPYIDKSTDGTEFKVAKPEHILDNEDIVNNSGHRRTGLVGQFSLFKNVVFTMTVLAQFLFNFGFYVPFVYLPDKSKLEGIDETSTVWILSTMGLSSIFGRIAFGYVADRPDVNRLLLYTSGFLISGVVTSLLPLYSQIWMLYCYAVIFGMFTGMVLSLTPVVLIDLLGLEILPATFGISCLFRGLASLLGSPCAGLLVDMTGQFTAAFIVPGLFMVLGAFVMSAAKYIKNE